MVVGGILIVFGALSMIVGNAYGVFAQIVMVAAALMSLGVALCLRGGMKKKYGGEIAEGYYLGFFAIAFSVTVPLISFICGGIGLSRAKRQLAKEQNASPVARNLNVAAIVIALIAVVVIAIVLSSQR